MLDIIVPCYNEEKIINKFFEKSNEELKSIKHRFIFIDDGSNDKTLTELKNIYSKNKECVKIISFSRNFGKESALYAGITNSDADFTCIIDADLQQNPKYLLQMYNFLNSNEEYDCICMCQKQNKKRFLPKVFYKAMNYMTDLHIENGASDFRMFRKKVTNSIKQLSEYNRFSKGIFSFVGFNTYYDEYEVEKRKEGQTKWNKKKLFNYAVSGITSFSTRPLRYIIIFGFIVSILSSIYLLYLLIMLIFINNIPIYMFLITIILVLIGIVFISLGILGEYIGNISNEIKKRPIYIAKEKLGFDDIL